LGAKTGYTDRARIGTGRRGPLALCGKGERTRRRKRSWHPRGSREVAAQRTVF